MPPRVLVDATAVPADRGGVGRYVDGLIAALGAGGRRSSPSSASARTPSGTAGMAPDADGRPRPCRDRAPPGAARLGADRPAAGRPAGRRRGRPLAALHDAAARRAPGRRDHARRHVLHRARDAHRGQGHVLPVGDAHLAAPRGAVHRAEQGDPRRAGPAARRRPDQARRRLPRRRPGRRSTRRARRRRRACERASGCGDAPTSRSSACSSRARTSPTSSAAGRRRSAAATHPPALVLAGGSGWDDDVDAAVADGARAPAACCAPATCASPTCPATSAARRSSPTPATARASGCRCSRRWPAARRCSPRPGCRCPRSAATRSPTPSPTPSSIAAALAALLDDPDRRAALGQAGATSAAGVHLGGERRGAPRQLRPRRRGLTQPPRCPPAPVTASSSSPTHPGERSTTSSTRLDDARPPLPYEVVLADNGVHRRRAASGRPRPAGRRAASRPGPTSATAGAANRGARRPAGEWLVVANPDIVWQPGSLDALLAAAEPLAAGPARFGPGDPSRRTARLYPPPAPSRRSAAASGTRWPAGGGRPTRGPAAYRNEREQPARGRRPAGCRARACCCAARRSSRSAASTRRTSCTSRTSTSRAARPRPGGSSVYVPSRGRRAHRRPRHRARAGADAARAPPQRLPLPRRARYAGRRWLPLRWAAGRRAGRAVPAGAGAATARGGERGPRARRRCSGATRTDGRPAAARLPALRGLACRRTWKRHARRGAGHPAAAAHHVRAQADAARRRRARSPPTSWRGCATPGSTTSCWRRRTARRCSPRLLRRRRGVRARPRVRARDRAARHGRRDPQRRGPVARRARTTRWWSSTATCCRRYDLARAGALHRRAGGGRHALPHPGGRPAGLRLRADRRGGRVTGVPGEDGAPGRPTAINAGLLRLPPLGHRRDPGRPGGVGRARDVPRAARGRRRC